MEMTGEPSPCWRCGQPESEHGDEDYDAEGICILDQIRPLD